MQINRIAEEGGLGMSLIRPRKDFIPRDGAADGGSASMDLSSSLLNNAEFSGGMDEASVVRAEKESVDPSAVDIPLQEVPGKPPTKDEVDMDGLVQSLGSSLQFLPPGVRRKKQAAKG